MCVTVIRSPGIGCDSGQESGDTRVYTGVEGQSLV